MSLSELSARDRARFWLIVRQFNELPDLMPDHVAAANRLLEIFLNCGPKVFETFEDIGQKYCGVKMAHLMTMKSDLDLCQRLFYAVGLRGI